MYRKGQYPETPKGVSTGRFRHNIRDWLRIIESCGEDALRHKNFNKVWTAEERYELVAKVMAGDSCTNVALNSGIAPGQLYNWIQKYKNLGYNGLVMQKKGRPSKGVKMEQKPNPTPLTESEREELIRLRVETEYLKAENEVIKKRIALRQEKEAARLKAKKQQSSKNSVKKDTN